ncbi:MAG: hypothetical protein ACJAVI_001751 [Candidatus Azotimanducaceae bacterium]|jgi:hypothetical protein
MTTVRVYGAPHSPWVQAVLLGLHDAGITHSLTTLPTLKLFIESGIMMPAAKIDERDWQLESTDILSSIGFEPVSIEQMQLVQQAWRGVHHRADSTALFWGGFSLAADRNSSVIKRLAHNFLRSFITLYFYLMIRILMVIKGASDPPDYGAQFLPFEEMLSKYDAPYLSGEEPNSLDYLIFGIIQCHSSIYVPPITALQSDPRLENLRNWISRMQARFQDYAYIYSGIYFSPHSAHPKRPPLIDRIAFWLGGISMVALFPITVPLVMFLALRVKRS